MKIQIGIALLVSGLLVTAGCGMNSTDGGDNPSTETQRTGLALTVDLNGTTEISAMRFYVETCDGEEVLTEERALEEMNFPNGVPDFINQALTDDSAYAFADHFMVLDAGCYNAEITPLDADGEPSEVCSPARGNNLQVSEGETTEVILVSQCGNEGAGAMDVLGLFNHAPRFTMLEYDPSKFLMCQAVTICATASDGDGNRLEFEWNQVSGPELAAGPTVTDTSVDGAEATECVSITPDTTGSYGFEVTVFDQVTGENGDAMRIETFFGDNGQDDLQSRATLAFPLYVNCPDGIEPEDVGGIIDEDVHTKGPEEVGGIIDEDAHTKGPEEVGGIIDEDAYTKGPEEVGGIIDNGHYKKNYKKHHSKNGPEEVGGVIDDDHKKGPEEVGGIIDDHKKGPEEVGGVIDEDHKKGPEEVGGIIDEDHKKGPEEVGGIIDDHKKDDNDDD
ncbi:MAG: hypothetical protein H0U74_00695 [Bradymonadaceae bacterium]|nr:hypothetical protein [Lujinxingiaceae bacterium]